MDFKTNEQVIEENKKGSNQEARLKAYKEKLEEIKKSAEKKDK